MGSQDLKPASITKISCFLLLSALLISGTNIWGQSKPHLMLKKAGTKKSIRFYPGEEMRFLSMNSPNQYSRVVIRRFSGDSLIVTDRGEINVLDLVEIDLREKLPSKEYYFYIAGVGYFGIDLLNQKLQGNPFSLYEGVIYSSAGLVATGLLIRMLRRKSVRLGRNWFVVIR